MAGVYDLTSARGAMDQYGTTGYDPAYNNSKNEERKYEAEVQNDWAMALYNRDLEQSQWERNVAYNDPSAMYERLLRAGMNPLAAMESIAGIGSTAPQSLSASGSVHAKTSGADTLARSQNLATVVSAAGQLSQGMKNLAEARNIDAHTQTWPSEVRTLQDVQRAQAGLSRVQSQWYPRIAASSSNAADAQAKMNSANALVQKEQQRLVGLQADYQQRQLNWFQTDKINEYERLWSEVQKNFASVKTSLAQVGYYHSAAGAQSALAKYYKAQENGQLIANVGSRLQNMSQQTGIPLNVLGGMLIYDLDGKGTFDQFGKWKAGKPFDVNDPNYQTYEKMKQFDFDNMESTRDIGQKTVTQYYWERYNMIHNNINGTIKAVGSVLNK